MHSIRKIDQFLTDYINQDIGKSREKIEDQIWLNYGREGAILILDMAGFSLSTKTHGIVYYLSLIKKMQQTVVPIIHNRNGYLVKFEADNAYACFGKAEDALQSGIDMKVAFEGLNKRYPNDQDILISVGIDYGKFLLLEEDNDFYGDPVNIASKLGEDLAGMGEILMTETAFNMLPEVKYSFEKRIFEISGIVIKSYRILYP